MPTEWVRNICPVEYKVSRIDFKILKQIIHSFLCLVKFKNDISLYMCMFLRFSQARLEEIDLSLIFESMQDKRNNF